jgi:large repetitive protein
VQANTWSGLYPGGVENTSNTGIFPDAVMKESFGLFQGITGTLKLTGLNLSMKYDLTFFASAALTGDVNVSYTVGNRTVMLNTAGNKSGSVTIYGVMADENGEVLIQVAPGTNTSQFGLLGALVINAYSPFTGIVPMPLAKSGAPSLNPGKQVVEDLIFNAFPNPFTKDITISFEANQNQNLRVTVYDMNGREVFLQDFSHLRNGLNQLKVPLQKSLSRGIYLVKAVIDGGRTGTVRIMKN